jgi:hypothetical protein
MEDKTLHENTYLGITETSLRAAATSSEQKNVLASTSDFNSSSEHLSVAVDFSTSTLEALRSEVKLWFSGNNEYSALSSFDIVVSRKQHVKQEKAELDDRDVRVSICIS